MTMSLSDTTSSMSSETFTIFLSISMSETYLGLKPSVSTPSLTSSFEMNHLTR